MNFTFKFRCCFTFLVREIDDNRKWNTLKHLREIVNHVCDERRKNMEMFFVGKFIFIFWFFNIFVSHKTFSISDILTVTTVVCDKQWNWSRFLLWRHQREINLLLILSDSLLKESVKNLVTRKMSSNLNIGS